ncbi:MAG: CBS domain-containing protein [Candidatus Aenigmarchaeota archaeon]|nr:CBS domain-containing protein [Candidatus Aenigmarchaeota archaeon]
MIELEEVGIDGSKNITNIATLNPVFCFEKEKIIDVAKRFAEYFPRTIPVVDKSKNLKGVITIFDIMDAYLKQEDFNQDISMIMCREVVFAEKSESIRLVLNKIKISKRGRLPVVDEDKLIGIVSETDFLRKTTNFSKLSEIKIGSVMVRKPFFIQPKNTILETIRIVVNVKYRRLPIVENGRLVGYITSTRLFSNLVKNNFSKEFVSKEISTIMTKNPITVSSSETLDKVLMKMRENDISSILVVDNGKLEGIFTERDYTNLLT